MMIFAFALTANASFMLMIVRMVYVVNVGVAIQNILDMMTSEVPEVAGDSNFMMSLLSQESKLRLPHPMVRHLSALPDL